MVNEDGTSTAEHDWILHTPYAEPTRHWKLDDYGRATAVIEPGRRPSSTQLPVPVPRGDTSDWTRPDTTVEPHATINEIREHVGTWRAAHWPGVLPRVHHLLEYWAREGATMRPFWCQREAVETLIWLFDAGRTQAPDAHAAIVERLKQANRRWNKGIPRVALKMATGTGKTNLMAMIALWWAVRHPDGPVEFLALTPGLTIRERLQVLANHDSDIWESVAPRGFTRDVKRMRWTIINFQAFQHQSVLDIGSKKASGKEKRLLYGPGPKPDLASWRESDTEMLDRLLKTHRGGGSIAIINDEAHHCYTVHGVNLTRGAADSEETEDRRRAELWFGALSALRAAHRMAQVFDLSATPMWLRRPASLQAETFPWTISDFSLIDAVESGLVKVPRVPVDDQMTTEGGEPAHLHPRYRNIYLHNQKRAITEPLTPEVSEPLHQLYDHYRDETLPVYAENDHTPVMDAIQVGQGPPGMLYELGRVYVVGLEAGGPVQAREDLTLHLGSDRELVEAVIHGFHHLVDRRDLPDLNGIVRLYGNGKMSIFASPFLAGLTEDEVAGTGPLQRLNDEGLGRALGFYLLSRLPTKCRPNPRVFTREEDCRPSWYRQALRDHPQAVADAFVAVHRVRVRAKEPSDQHLYDLARTDEYAAVARLAVPRMFAPFPSRCSAIQLETLRQVLRAALRHMCSTALRELVQTRLARKGMDIGQCTQWLATGALVLPEEWLPKLVGFLSDEEATRSRYLEQRVRHLVNFLVPDREPFSNREWPTAYLASLIRAVGRWVRSPSDYCQDSSDRFKAVRIAESDIKAPPLVQHWIDTLVERADDQALAVLGNLAEDPVLEAWRGQLVRALDTQAERLRKAKYHAPALSEIREAVDGGPPAGTADLAALVTEKLNWLADNIRNGNTNDWRQYWHTDPKDPQGRKVIRPKPEELCRDYFLSDLRPYLSPYGVYAEQEGHHAEDTRSDILTVHGAHAVPVEIKKTNSRDLWSAIKDQLIAKYVRDPRSGGYGIYLVLWFGHEHLKSAPPVGPRPDSPDRLRQLLEDMLEPAQCRTITIVVVDVSDPHDRRPVVHRPEHP